MRKYLSLEYGSGKIFEYSKESKPGYEKYTTKKGDVSYRNYFLKGIRGEYKGFKIEDGKFGEQIKVGLEADGILYIVCMNTQSGSYYDNDFFVPFLQYLKSMKVGETYLVQPYKFTPDDSKYEKKGVSVKDEEDNPIERGLSMSYFKDKKLVKGDIPALEFKQKGKKWELDKVAAAKRDEYLSEVIDEISPDHESDFSGGIKGYNVTSADYNTSKSNSEEDTAENATQEQADETKTPSKEKAEVVEDDDDDLPF
jgi:hypothetical protein